MSRAAITVEGLGKAYRIGLKEEIPDTLVSAMASWAKMPLRNFRRLSRLNTFGDTGESEDTVWALRDVSFEVQEGDVVGVIGRNGAGKSTLLKILSRITEPTSGRAVIHGRVSSLLEVGTGFHPELSGRENIYMNGTILGMTKREIDRKFDEIVEFSGVEKFLDTPIKRYSSGMKVRLAFSVAAHLDPEILIVDEVLAVGDAEFQQKCLGKMQDVATSGRTVLFVSHNMAAVRALTSKGLYLRSGALVHAGCTASAIDRYLHDSVSVVNSCDDSLDYFRRAAPHASPVKFSRIWVEPSRPDAAELPLFDYSQDFTIYFEVQSDIAESPICLSATLNREHQGPAVTLFSPDLGFRPSLRRGTNVLACSVAALPLSPGRYTLTAGINRSASAKALDVILDYPLFDIRFTELESGGVDWPTRPWGAVHWNGVEWQSLSSRTENIGAGPSISSAGATRQGIEKCPPATEFRIAR